MGSVYGIYMYDSSQAAGAYKVGAEMSLADFIPGGSIAAWTLNDDGETDYVKGHDWGVTAKMNLTDSLVLSAGYGESFWHYENMWTVDLNWAAAPGLDVRVEYSKRRPDLASESTGRYALRVTRSF